MLLPLAISPFAKVAIHAQPPAGSTAAALTIASRPVQLEFFSAGPQTIRITVLPADDPAAAAQLASSPALVLPETTQPAFRFRSLEHPQTFQLSGLRIAVSDHPLRIAVTSAAGRSVQTIQIDSSTGNIRFPLGSGPLYGLGEGGPQTASSAPDSASAPFTRRGNAYPMRTSQDAYDKPHFGGRLAIPWLLGNGWALFLHDPQGAFDLTGPQAIFTPSPGAPLPIDIFLAAAPQPDQALAAYARITGHPSMPPLWALGYQQSHRTVENWQALDTIARTFREKELPCDVLIYLGTGFAPSGWNTGPRSFHFNPVVFPDPPANIRELHDLHFKVVLHVVGPPKELAGDVSDAPDAGNPNSVATYWSQHAPVERLGVDGWWPDEGEWLSRESRLARVRMYWQGPQQIRPNLRPYTLNRTGFSGMQRMGGWLWSGDTNSTWQTLADQIPVGLNAGLSGIPYWGTDIGGFFSTPELDGELYARWFEFAAFTPLFRSHGRPSATRYPWSWNSGQIGNPELSPNVPGSAPPSLDKVHNPAIEPVCRKYLNLRYRLMPYLYAAAWQTHLTGVPIMRALWLDYPDDLQATSRSHEYLWGRDLLIAPVTQKAATVRKVYLPHGLWYDFWTRKPIHGGREVTRTVDLATIPIYARAGTILPTGPLKQYTSQKVPGPLTLTIYPGANGHILLYDDDGVSFNFRQGQYTTVSVDWNDGARRLTITPRHGSQTWNELTRTIEIKEAIGGSMRTITLGAHTQTLQF
ncbi:MAG TPA: TIM-barrel domain-containing protein [Terracidiphilus sp.]